MHVVNYDLHVHVNFQLFQCIHAVREAAKRLNGKRLVNRKDPVSLDMMRKI